ISPRQEIVVMAHRDDTAVDTGLNDNASGTAALVELARSYAPTAAAQRVSLPYSLVFLSTDGGAEGARGAAHFAADPHARQNILAVVNLDSIGGRDGTGRRSRPGAGELRLSRSAAHSRLGRRDRSRLHAAAVPRGRGRPLRALPPPSDQHRAGPPQLPQPTRLLGLDRRALPRLRSVRLLGRRRRTPAVPEHRHLAGRSADRPRPARRSRLDRGPQPAAAAARDPSRRAPRRSQRRAPRTRRRRASGGGDESVRPHLRPAVAPRLALAAPGADSPPRSARGRVPSRLRGTGLSRVVICHALWARLGRAVVRRQALRRALRAAAPARDR